VAGDNRDYSSDSRHWGFVNQRELIGKPLFVWWSWDHERQRVRWERIGKRLD
jgi:signal peptidase I